MNHQEIIEKTETFVKDTLEGEGSGHDWWHIYAVRKNAMMLGKQENVDLFIVELAALLHDIADWKFNKGDTEAGSRKAKEWLTSLNLESEKIEHICQIIRDLSFKGAGVKTPMKTKEGEVVQDADRLEALGAMGIARTFAYGGHKGREIYNPNIKPTMHETFEQYRNDNGHTINHFYEKLLLLKELMNTKTGKEFAESRHQFMEQFLEQFFAEWNGKK